MGGQDERNTASDADKQPSSWFDGCGEIVVPALCIAVILLAMLSVFFYPVAWLLGFRPCRWWSKAPGPPGDPGWFVSGVFGLVFCLGLVVSCIFFFGDLFEPFLH